MRLDMLAAASDLTYLTAWMAMYEKAHGLGQTYYVKALKPASEAQPKPERQGRVHLYALLAQRQYPYGHFDASCHSWGRFLDEYEHISSARGDDHFETMRTQLRRHVKERPVRELAGCAREVAALKS